MRLERIEELRITFGVVGLTGLISAIVGGGCILAGSASIAAKYLNVLNPKPAAIHELFHNGGLFFGGGLFLLGGGMAVCDRLNDIECDLLAEELRSDEKKLKEIIIPDDCKRCKYFSNSKYLPCAVNPNLELNCRDWEPR